MNAPQHSREEPTFDSSTDSSTDSSADSSTDSSTPLEPILNANDTDPRWLALEAKHAELSDAYMRAKAEVENTRRRAEEEVAKARKFSLESFAESLLPVKDSLESAIAMPNATPEQMLEGVHATLRQLKSALDRNKVMEINPPTGEKFDPHHHQAISVVPADQEPNTVVAVLQKGYAIAERVLRPALVTVSQ